MILAEMFSFAGLFDWFETVTMIRPEVLPLEALSFPPMLLPKLSFYPLWWQVGCLSKLW